MHVQTYGQKHKNNTAAAAAATTTTATTAATTTATTTTTTGTHQCDCTEAACRCNASRGRRDAGYVRNRGSCDVS